MNRTVITAAILLGTTIVSGCEWLPEMQTRAAPPAEAPAPSVRAAEEPVSTGPHNFVPRGTPDGENDDSDGGGEDDDSDDGGGSNDDGGGSNDDGGFGGDGGGGGGGWG